LNKFYISKIYQYASTVFVQSHWTCTPRNEWLVKVAFLQSICATYK
jgi:hypothetical protein